MIAFCTIVVVLVVVFGSKLTVKIMGHHLM